MGTNHRNVIVSHNKEEVAKVLEVAKVPEAENTRERRIFGSEQSSIKTKNKNAILLLYTSELQ